MATKNLSDMTEMEGEIIAFISKGEGDFASLMLRLHGWQREHCAPYRAYCAALPEASRWEDIPAMPLSAFRQGDIRSFPEEETICTFHTSGTTGEGYGKHHFRTLEVYRAAALAGWDREGLGGRRIIGLLPGPTAAPNSSLNRMAGWLVAEEDFFHGDWSTLREAVDGASGAVTLFGTALAFLDVFEWLGERDIRLPEGSIAVETGGYKGSRRDMPKRELYAMFHSKLGLEPERIWNEYGMTELSSQFYTQGVGAPHRGAPWVKGLVIDPETNRLSEEGETGVLRIFDLANVGSCCAIQTRDLAIRRGEGFELLGRDPAALPRGCSRSADEMLSAKPAS